MRTIRKLPNVIIVATAWWLNVPLLTNDKKLLGIAEIEAQALETGV